MIAEKEPLKLSQHWSQRLPRRDGTISSQRWSGPPRHRTFPAYPINPSKMQPVTKISVFGVRLGIAVLLLYWVAIFAGTHVPSLPAIGISANDKIKHFSAFFLLGALLCYVTNSERWWLRFGTIGMIGMAYGAIDEVTQRFVPGRCPDVMDFAADAAGLWAAIAIYLTAKVCYANRVTS